MKVTIILCDQPGPEEIIEINPAYGQLQGMLNLHTVLSNNCALVARIQHEKIESSVNPAYSTIMLHRHNDDYETVL